MTAQSLNPSSVTAFASSLLRTFYTFLPSVPCSLLPIPCVLNHIRAQNTHNPLNPIGIPVFSSV